MADLLTTVEQNLLAAQKTTGTVPLNATTLTAAGAPVVAVFQAALGAPSFAFAGSANVGLAAGKLTVVGPPQTPVLGLGAPTVTATLTTATDVGSGATVLDLVLTIPAEGGWTLATTFPQLAGTALNGLQFAGPPTFVLRSSDGPADVYGPLEPAGLNVEATITVKDAAPLDALDPILKLTQSTLAVAGPATALVTEEALQLRTGPLGASVQMAVAGVRPLSLSGAAVVIQGRAAKGLEEWAAAIEVAAWGAAAIGASPVAFSVTPAVGLAPWRLAVVPGLGVRLSQLLGVVPGLSVAEALPDAVRAAVDAEVVTFAFLLGGTSPALTPLALQIAIEGVAPWTIVENVVELEAVAVDLDVAFQNGPTVQSGSVHGTIALGDPGHGKGIEIGTSVPIPLSGGTLSVWANPHVGLPGLGALARLIGGADFASALPAGLADVGGFNLDLLSVDIDTSGPSIQSVGIGLSSDPWTIIKGQLVVQGVSLQLQVLTPFATPAVVGRVGGVLIVGKASLEAVVQRYTADAHWELSVEAANVVLPSLDDLTQLAGYSMAGVVPDSISKQHFTLVDIRLDVDLTSRTLEIFSVEVATEKWDIAPGYFAVDSITGTLAIDWRSGTAVAYGSIAATLAFGDGAAQLVLSGIRDQEGGWTLSGTLTDDVDLVDLVRKALNLPVPAELGKLTVSPVSLTYRTKEESYDFNAAAKWTPSISAVRFELDASVELHRTPVPAKPGQFSYAGAISADLSAHFASHALSLSVGYVFQTQNSTTSYVFGLKYDGLSLTGTYKKGASGDEIVTIRLGGVTFGGIVTYLVNLVDPDRHFSLSAPWDVLNKISFDNLSLTINLTQRSVGISYAVNANLGLIDIETIGLTYLHKGGSATVEIEFTGSFLGQKYTPDKPLGWDMLNESPPTPSGQGSQLFDLRLLGIGQHLVLADPHADTMAKIIKDLDDVVDQTKDSPKPWELLKFDPSAGWLFAADFTVMDTLTLRLVFDDPVLYGVEITLAGEKAGPFAGLDFEILYRKLSDSLGVYHIALTLPDVMRHLEFGEVSVTLPNVVVDIYTDGSFYLDFGFPYNNDWTVCFGLQVFPFVGAGGFYFGKLSTAAAAGTGLVPNATNGTFGPVIEFGVALQIGVGKSISEGPLSAGVSVTVQGIVTGVVSWFNPTDASQGSDQYYKIEGSVAVVGQLYGRVDFKIITIDISIVASATVSLTVECYQPILIGLSLEVEVHASIKIIFFTIHFSFGFHLDASFTIGSAQATPWHLAEASGGGPQMGTSVAARRRTEHGHAVHAGARALLAVAAPQAQPLTWPAAAVMGGSQVQIDVELVPLFTPAGNGAAAVQIVMAAFVQTSAAAGAAHDAWRAAVGTDEKAASELPFNVVAESLLKWGMNTLIGQHSGPITAVDLQLIYEDLCRPDIGATGFAYDNVTDFLGLNVKMNLVPPPAPADDVARTVLPIPPPLQMTAPGLKRPVQFWQTPSVGTGYQEELLRLADQLAVNFDYSRAHDPLAPEEDTTKLGAGEEPITEALFGDWFLMVARSVVQSARSILHEHDHDLTAEHEDSLADLAARFAPSVQYTMRAGDTFASIAALFGITTTQLVDDPANRGRTIEPGKTLTVPPAVAEVEYVTVPGDTVEDLAAAWHTHSREIEEANPGVQFSPLAAGTAIRIPVREELLAIADANLGAKLGAVQIPISGLRYQVRAGDTLGAVAAVYGQDADALAEPNADDPTVLQAGATLQIAQAGSSPASIPYTTVADDTLATLAAMLLVRNEASVEQAFGSDPSYNWLANAIPANNPSVVFTDDLATGIELKIPNVLAGDKGLEPAVPPVVQYTTKASDTLPLVAATFVMTELRPTDPGLAALETAIQTLNPTVDWTPPLAAGTALKLPGQGHQIAPGDTLQDLANRFWLTVSDLAVSNSGLQVLSPTATIALPAGMPIAATGLTGASLAAKLGLTTDELVGRIGAHRGIFMTPQRLKIQRAREYDVDELMGRIVDSGDANSAAGQASSFLLQGLRAPDPGAPSTYRALYDLTEQQFAAPAAPQDYTITFTAPTTPPWLTLPGGQVAVAITQADMQSSWPSTTLDPQIEPGYPTALPLGRAQPVRHPVGTPTPWAAPTPPSLPGPPPPAGGGPVLFPLPASATSRAANSPTPHQYELATTPKGRQADPTPVPTYAWATWVPFTVRRVPAAGGGWTQGTYVAIGADQTGADALLSLWTYLQSSGAPATLGLAYQTASGTGLVSDALGPGTALLKVNLSTETHSPPVMVAALLGGTPPPAAYALLTEAQAFVQLLWEATITGTGGFYLTYDTTTHGPLPDAAFASGDDAQLFLVALLDDQTRASAPDRALHPFTTGAVVEGNLDPSRSDIFAQATDGSDMTESAIVPPGNVGYVLERANPSPVAGVVAVDDPSEDLTRGLYSMLSFTLSGNLFKPPELVFPTGPVKDGDPSVWHYDRTIPVFRLVTTPPAALPAALPAAAGDPYAGVAAGSQVTLDLSFRDRFGNELGDSAGTVGPIDVGYTDPVLGLSAWPGVTAAYAVGGPDGAATLALSVDLALTRYVPSPDNLFAAAVRTAAAHQTTYKQIFFQLRREDVAAKLVTSLDAAGTPCLQSTALKPPLLGLVTAAYVYLGAAAAVAQAELTVPQSPAQTLAGQAQDLVVSAAQLAAANAAADASQLFSGSLTIPVLRVVRPSDTLTTLAGNLSVAALLDQNEDVPLNPGTVVQTAVRTYTAAAGDTLTSIAQLEDTTPSLLAYANSNTPGLLQPQTVPLGTFTLDITAQDTFTTLVSKLHAYDPTITVPGAGQLLANVATIFVPQTTIAIATSPVSPDDTTGARTCTVGPQGEALAAIAARTGCTAVGLALANGQRAGVLQPSASVDVEGVTVLVGANGTIVSVTLALRAEGAKLGIAEVAMVGIAGVTAAIQGRTDLLVPNADLAVVDHVVQKGDTIATVPALSVPVLSLLDADAPPNVFATGTALTVSSSQYRPQAGDTLTAIAADNGLKLDQLAAAIGDATLAPGAPVVVPGGMTAGRDAPVPFQVPAGAATPTIDGVAGTFGTTAGALGTLNADMPGLLAGGIAINYPGHPLTTTDTSTLRSLAAQAGVGVDVFTADPSVAGNTELVAAGALFACPLPPVKGSLDDMSKALGVLPLDLASANSALMGLVTSTHAFAVTVASKVVTVTSGTGDTLQSLVRRLQAQAPGATLADLVASCGGDQGALVQGVGILVPPAAVSIEAALGEPVHVASTFAPLDVTLTVARDPALVAPEFAAAADVVANATAIAPALGDPPSLVPFATAFEAAFASRRLKLATGPSATAGTPQVWIVDFGAGGLAEIAVDGDRVRFHAVAPMSTTLAGGQAPIRPYDPKTGKLGAEVTQTIASADLDSWMRIALGAIDLVLSPTVAAAVWRQDALSLDSLVASKQTIAEALRDRVSEILRDDSPDAGALASARDAMYQSMLVSLSSAYTTDAVVTYPVTVQSPFTAPYATGSADGFPALATAYGVSPEGVAWGLADAPSILAKGTISADGNTYAITDGETLRTLATAVGVDVTALPTVVTVPANTPLFKPGITLAQSAMTRTVVAGDTFASLGAFFGADPGAVGLAARLVPGLVPEGRTVTVDGTSYPVKQGDTLTDIAAALSQAAGHAISVQDVAAAPAVVDDPTLLAANTIVHCFSSVNLVAPRLSGKATTEQYRVQPGDGMDALVAWYDVSLERLADVLAQAQILNAGTPGNPVTATWSGNSAPIAPDDTLTTLAAKLQAKDVLTLLAGLTLAPAGAGLLRPSIRVSLGRISRTPSSADSFASLAAYFEDDPSSFAVANQDRPGVLATGTELKLDGHTYQVGGKDTLVDVATALGTDPRGLAVAPGIGDLAGIFSASPVYDLQVLPEFSLSTAKTPLADGTDHVSFLFGTNADASFKSLFLDVGYEVAEIETDIRNVPGAGDYQASDWLRLVVPLGATAFGGAVDLTAGQTQVPIALRAFPLLPSVVDLAAEAAWPAPTTIAEAKQWELMAAVQHQSAAQDAIELEVTFGAAASLGNGDGSPDLFTALAQFVTAWPDMQTDVAALAAMPAGAQTDEMQSLAKSLASIAAELATAMKAQRPLAVGSSTGQLFDFRLEPTIDHGLPTPVIDLFDLTVTRTTVPDPDAVPWPTVYLDDPKKPLQRARQGPGVMRYFYAEAARPPAFQSLTQYYVFPGDTPGRDAVAFQTGQVAAAVQRNADLVTTAKTADAFLYQTPWVSFSAAAVPFLQTASPIAIGTGADLTAPLTKALTELLTIEGDDSPVPGPSTVRLLVTYERTLAGASGGGPIAMPLPVVYVPQWSLAGNAIATLAGDVAAQVTKWFNISAIQQHPGDTYVVDLSIFATADLAMTRPLVETSRLTVPLA